MFSAELEKALRVAEIAHRGQERKGPERTPYVLHPIHCALLLARLGYPDAVIQAAILHDVVEDCEGWTVDRVEAEFGRETADIVAQLTEDKSKSWEERKSWQIEHVRELTPHALAVKAADKLHNLSTLAADLAAAPDPNAIWQRFEGGRDRTIAMARALVEELAPRVEPGLGRALREAIAQVERNGSR